MSSSALHSFRDDSRNPWFVDPSFATKPPQPFSDVSRWILCIHRWSLPGRFRRPYFPSDAAKEAHRVCGSRIASQQLKFWFCIPGFEYGGRNWGRIPGSCWGAWSRSKGETHHWITKHSASSGANSFQASPLRRLQSTTRSTTAPIPPTECFARHAEVPCESGEGEVLGTSASATQQWLLTLEGGTLTTICESSFSFSYRGWPNLDFDKIGKKSTQQTTFFRSSLILRRFLFCLFKTLLAALRIFLSRFLKPKLLQHLTFLFKNENMKSQKC